MLDLKGRFNLKSLAHYYSKLKPGMYGIGLCCQNCCKEIIMAIVYNDGGWCKYISFACPCSRFPDTYSISKTKQERKEYAKKKKRFNFCAR